MLEVKNSIVSSISNYLEKLQYLAVDDGNLSEDIMLLVIADEVYDWGSWYNTPQSEQLKLQELRKQLIRNNPGLVEPINRTNEFYKNVNIQQNLYTWQRIYDSFDVQEETVITPQALPVPLPHLDSNGNSI